MAIHQQLAPRGYDVSEVFSATPDPAPSVLCTYTDYDDEIQAKSNTFTIVMNRDIIKSVEIASAMAVHMARKYPDQKVLLVNTYAGAELMQRTLAKGLAMSEVKLPPSFSPLLDGHYKDSIDETLGPAPPAACTSLFPANLRVLDAPTGTLDAWRIEGELDLMEAEPGNAIVILNSFECSVWGYWRDRKLFAEQLVELRARRSLTCVIFSHEIRADVQRNMPARGGIGIISAFADSVWYLMRQADRAKFNAYYKRIASLTVPPEPTKKELEEREKDRKSGLANEW